MKRILITLLPLLLLSCAHQPTGREQLLSRLTTLQQQGCMFGHQDDPMYGIGWAWDRDRSDVLETCGDYPAVMGFDLGGIEMGDEKNLDSVPFSRTREEIRRHYARGGIITLSWHPRNPVTTYDAIGTWPVGSAWEANDGTVAAVLSSHDSIFSLWLERVADYMLTIKTAEGQPIPFIFRPWHENNGGWFWWGASHCTADEFRTLWNRTQDYLLSRGLDNIVWAYSPNLDGSFTEERFLERYPGDDRVDLIGLDAYQWGTEEDFVRQTHDDLRFLTDFAEQHHKLLALTECGYKNLPDPTWWHRVLLPIIRSYPLSHALVWRNAEHEFFGPVPGTPNGNEFMIFFRDSHILFLNDINK